MDPMKWYQERGVLYYATILPACHHAEGEARVHRAKSLVITSSQSSADLKSLLGEEEDSPDI